MILKQSLAFAVFLWRKVRRTLGFPVMDVTKSDSELAKAVRDLEAKPPKE